MSGRLGPGAEPVPGLRRELAELVAARGLSLLDAWLGPVETKLEILAVLASGRNLLLEGPVGSGKTLLGASIAAALPPIRLAGCHFNCLPGEAACPQCRAGLAAAEELELSGPERFVRVQGSPDLFPEDLVGDIDPAAALAHGALDPRAFRPGRLVRAHRRLCFVDEINRLSERLQNLFLELLAERALTIGGYEARFPVDTVVVATMNPDEYVGVGRLSEALRDRFERVRLDYPTPADEVAILLARTGLDGPVDSEALQLAEAVVGFATRLRAEPEVESGPSVRATLASFELALAWSRCRSGAPLGAPEDGGRDWRQAAVAGLRVALRGRLSLCPTHELAARPEVFVDEALASLVLWSMPSPNERLIALRSVAVVRWLRRHPLVEGGPGVRASQALAEITGAHLRLVSPSTSTSVSGSPGGTEPDQAFLLSALVALPHRLRVRPGVDADALVRQAVTEALLAPPEGRPVPAPDGEDTDRGDANTGDDRLRVMVALASEGHRPTTAAEERALRGAFGDEEAARFLEELLGPGAALPPMAGPAPTRPARRAVGEEVLAVRPFRPGDRARDFARQSVRATLRTGTLAPRALSRLPTAVFDVVIALDASASMGKKERPLVAPATAALARVLLRQGHRVGAVAFSEEAVPARPLSRSRTPLLAEDYAFAHATNVESGIDAARLLLLREGASGARRHVIVVTDAECTSHSGTAEAWGPLGVPRGSAGLGRLLAGGMVDAARRAALIAASRCRRHGITVSVAYPDPAAEVAFAHELAAAGSGRARCLRA